MAGGGLEDDAGVAGEFDFGAALDPAVVDGEGGAVGTESGGEVGGLSGDADDEASEAEAVGGGTIFAGLVECATFLIEGAGGEVDEQEGEEDFVFGLGLDLTLGGHGEGFGGG